MARTLFFVVLLFAGPGRAWAQASAGAAGAFKPAPPAPPTSDAEPAKKKTPPAPPAPPAPPPVSGAAPPPPAPSGATPAPSQAYPPPPAPGGAPPANAPQPAPPPGYYASPPGYPPPPPGYAYPGYAPPPPGYAYPAYPYQPYPGAYPPYPPPPRGPGWHQHDGFFLRMNFGFGASSIRTDNAGSAVELSGGGAELAIALGGALTSHLILYGEFSAISSSPDLKVAGESRPAGSGNVSVLSIGPGLAYYFGERNYYASATLSFAQLDFNDLNINRSNQDSDWGVSFRAMFGKEWWVSDNWGVGAALTLTFASIKDSNLETGNTGSDTPRWRVAAFGLLFSATYN